jgi:hypothetical protein
MFISKRKHVIRSMVVKATNINDAISISTK